ncbi:Panacea domain-containing protein [Arthrobacter sp. zg-Y1110]|uniref:Panacea domain-containing protein n=1 Tax=Arthrobacter sp. zg-Y1110 TaxID=2886932 RepID=UPI001D148D90|nr:type II toxin-antitoxin system antitoxin SocA domain-containing protein [Arthrobacter sp. zg-Y1110]MCC3292134.1 DUF4065 domain-containing protein [Arthrobacter sp. zg-Y1110]UWX85223.1 DUF4065 domain-containing protein [Arthrobacter sp. zg-Y1110]
MATIHDVAAYIVQHFRSDITPMKLQKLTFFSQGWSLALLDEPLFNEKFQAWVNGPVSYELFDLHRGQWAIDSWDHGNPNNLTPQQKIVVDAALRNYGALSGRELSELTHQPGTPWSETRYEEGVGPNQRSTASITDELMKSYFQSIL